MRAPRALLVALLAVASACGGVKPEARCSAGQCPSGQLCDAPSGFCVDDVDPSLALTSPTADALVSGGELQLSGKATDDDGNAPKVEVSADGQTWTTVTVHASGEFVAVLPLPALDFSALTVHARATDSVGQTAQTSVPLTVDNVAPRCAVLSPAEGSLIAAAGLSSISVSFSIQDGAPAGNAFISLDDAGFVPAARVAGEVIHPFPLSGADNDRLHSATLRFTDSAGNTCPEAVARFRIDDVAPTLSLLGVDAGERLGQQRGNPVLLAGLAIDGDRPLPSFALRFSDAGVRAVPTDGGDWTTPLALDPADDHVARELELVAVDDAGNVSRVVVPVVVDQVAPRLAFTFPPEGERFNKAALEDGGAVDVVWTREDGDPAFVVQLALGDGGFVDQSSTAIVVSTSPADDGVTHRVALRAEDLAGNRTELVRTFVVDRLPPQPRFNALDGERAGPRTLTVEFGERVTLLQDPPVFLSPSIAGSFQPDAGRFTVSLPPSTRVTAAVIAGAVSDSSGNLSEAGASLTFFTEPVVPSDHVVAFRAVDFRSASDPFGLPTVASLVPDGGAGFHVVEVWQAPQDGGSGQTFAPVTDNRAGLGSLLAYAFPLADGGIDARVGFSQRVTVGGRIPLQGQTSCRRQSGAWSCAPPSTGQPKVLLPTPPACAEDGGADFGELLTDYRRFPVADLPLSMTTSQAIFHSEARWDALQDLGDGVIKRRSYTCDCASCRLSLLETFDGGSLEAVAPSDSLRLFSFRRDGARVERCEQCVGAACSSTETVHADGGTLLLATDWSGRVYGAALRDGGASLYRWSPDGGCPGAWMPEGIEVAGAAIGAKPRLQMIGNRPGFVSLGDGGTVRLFRP